MQENDGNQPKEQNSQVSGADATDEDCKWIVTLENLICLDVFAIRRAAGAEGARYTESIFNLSGKRTENYTCMSVWHVLFVLKKPES